MVQRLQALCPAHRLHTVPSVHRFRRAPLALSQVIFLSAALAEAATQLSFAEFLERCISLSAPPPPPLLISTPPLDAATQTTPHIAVSQDVSAQLPLEGGHGSTFDTGRYLPHVFPTHPSATPRRGCADAFAQPRLTMRPPNYCSRSSLLDISSPMTLWIAKPHHRHIAMQVTPHLHNPLT